MSQNRQLKRPSAEKAGVVLVRMVGSWLLPWSSLEIMPYTSDAGGSESPRSSLLSTREGEWSCDKLLDTRVCEFTGGGTDPP
jgi:hypothetical protein